MLVKCPTCRKETPYDGNPYRPFCSERCQLIDLGEWAQEKFAIPDENDKPKDSDPESTENE
jgi:uncharacterized protein